MKLDISSDGFHHFSNQLSDSQMRESDEEGGLDFTKVLGAIRRQSWVIAGTTILFVTIGGIKAATDTPIYRAQFELLAEPLSLESQVISSTTPESLSNRQDVVEVVPNEAKLKILKSPRILQPLVEELQQQYPEISYESLANNVNLDANVENNIVRVQYQDDNPQQVQDVLDRLVDTYLEFSLEVRQSELRQGLAFVEKQLPKLRSRVDEIQDRLQALRQENNLIDPTIEAQQLSNQINIFVEQRLEAQAQLNEVQLVAQNLEKELSNKPVEQVAASALSTPRYQALLNQLQAVDTKIAQQSVTFAESSPQLEMLREQRKNLIPLLKEESKQVQRGIESNIQELQARDRALDQTIAGLNQRSKQLSEITRRYTDFQRELEIASKNLNQFLTKREALRIDVAQSESPWELLTPTHPPVASSTSLKRNLVLGTALGLLLGIGAALTLDKFRNLLHSTREVQEIAGLTLLGSIPFDQKLFKKNESAVSLLKPASQKLLNDKNPPAYDLESSIIESFRSLYTNIRLLNPDAPVRSLVVSSATPGEGKSTVATHLAKAAAAMGCRVLLVDTDLRSPNLYQSTKVVNSLGLTDLIRQEDLEIDQVIEQDLIENSLFFLSTGQTPPDPSRLLASQRMRNLMEELHTQFELVIYDATILSGYSDAHLLASATNGLMLVTSIGKLKRSMLEATIENLKNSRIPILGMVVNRDNNLALNLYN
jgi:capsular exopolysaccharide synthesis family protein